MDDFISDGIRSAYSDAQSDLILCLAHTFGWDLEFGVLLQRAEEFLVKKIGDQAHSVVNFIKNQDDFFSKYHTFYSGHQFTAPPSLDILETLIGAMVAIASWLGDQDCVDKMKRILYNPFGPEEQQINDQLILIPKESLISTHHVMLSKLASYIGHDPPHSSGSLQKFNTKISSYRSHYICRTSLSLLKVIKHCVRESIRESMHDLLGREGGRMV